MSEHLDSDIESTTTTPQANVEDTRSDNTIASDTSLDRTLGLAELQEALAIDPNIDLTLIMSGDAAEETYSVGGISFKINVTNPTVNPATVIGVLFTKEHRPDVGSKEESELIKAITTNQYVHQRPGEPPYEPFATRSASFNRNHLEKL